MNTDHPALPLGAPSLDSFIQQMEQILLQHHAPMATLKLTAFATDAMRVLRLLEQHANMSKSFDQAVRAACADWRNPFGTNDPADLIAVALGHAIAALQRLFDDIDCLLEAMQRPSLVG